MLIIGISTKNRGIMRLVLSLRGIGNFPGAFTAICTVVRKNKNGLLLVSLDATVAENSNNSPELRVLGGYFLLTFTEKP
ncbi:MAG: hypothetical protein PHN60_04625 [Candidatus Gracilibacteria bacterium]|nr:hypothetical protein [Candidatus Gracilibacteria bacterium]